MDEGPDCPDCYDTGVERATGDACTAWCVRQARMKTRRETDMVIHVYSTNTGAVVFKDFQLSEEEVSRRQEYTYLGRWEVSLKGGQTTPAPLVDPETNRAITLEDQDAEGIVKLLAMYHAQNEVYRRWITEVNERAGGPRYSVVPSVITSEENERNARNQLARTVEIGRYHRRRA